MIATNYQRSTRAYGKHGGIMPIICSIVIDLAAIRYHVRIDIGCMRVWPSPEYVGGGCRVCHRATVKMDRAHWVVGMSNADIPIDADRL